MPTLTRKTPLDPQRLVRAWQSFYGPAGSVKQGDELRASDPLVLQGPANYVEMDVPRSEWPTVLDRAFETQKEQAAAIEAEKAAAFERLARANPIKIAPPPMFRLTADLVAYRGGPALIERGSIVLAGDPLIVEHPDSFTELA